MAAAPALALSPMRTRMVPEWPSRAATCTGVRPYMFATFGSAP